MKPKPGAQEGYAESDFETDSPDYPPPPGRDAIPAWLEELERFADTISAEEELNLYCVRGPGRCIAVSAREFNELLSLARKHYGGGK